MDDQRSVLIPSRVASGDEVFCAALRTRPAVICVLAEDAHPTTTTSTTITTRGLAVSSRRPIFSPPSLDN